ncbi:SDR family NAD(P)-dependent oxidoreductase [Streptomyces sp. NPDC050658]|uniref:SDR family NAD(P)-dependent oxidoreductase n=1 Tax=unclassified Streptomyces TaxID=2593676 RepID=UPI0034134FCC
MSHSPFPPTLPRRTPLSRGERHAHVTADGEPEITSPPGTTGLRAQNPACTMDAAREFESLGGRSLVHEADPDQVEAAVAATEEHFGPVDVWINCAFSTVFARFEEISYDEYQRATEAMYLGFVNGTRSALRRMGCR